MSDCSLFFPISQRAYVSKPLKELKHLEENLLISRTIVSKYPVRIEYTITDYCLSIDKVAKPMEEWGKGHKKKNCFIQSPTSSYRIISTRWEITFSR